MRSGCGRSAVAKVQPGGAVKRVGAPDDDGRGEDILVSVPKAVATGQWLVSAFRVDETGTQKAVDGLGTPTLHDVHTTRIQTDAAGDQGFFLGIIEFNDNAQNVTGSWVVQVKVKN